MTCQNCKGWHELTVSQQEQLKLKNQQITDERNSKYLWIGATVFMGLFGFAMLFITIHNLKN